MKNQSKTLVSLFLLLSAGSTLAHKRWVLPTLFTMSEHQWIAVDATVSNNIFYPDRPWKLNAVQVVAPDGTNAVIENQVEGHRRSTFDTHLNQSGTFKISLGGEHYFARYPKNNPKPDERPFHTIRAGSLKELKSKIPNQAKEVKMMVSNSRLESYVTVGAPSNQVFKPANNGIELVGGTHPNDLYQGEKATFKFLFDGLPIEGVKALMVREGTRYRNEEQAVEVVTNADGEIIIDLTHTGRFLLEIEHSIDLPENSEISSRGMAYFGSFEVLPQ